MNYSDLITLILTQLRTHVNSDQFLEQFRRSKAFVRHRKLTLKQVVAYLMYTNMPLVQKAGLDTVFSLLMDLRWRSHYPTTHPLNLERLQAVITRIFAGWRVFFPLSMMSFLIR